MLDDASTGKRPFKWPKPLKSPSQPGTRRHLPPPVMTPFVQKCRTSHNSHIVSQRLLNSRGQSRQHRPLASTRVFLEIMRRPRERVCAKLLSALFANFLVAPKTRWALDPRNGAALRVPLELYITTYQILNGILPCTQGLRRRRRHVSRFQTSINTNHCSR